MAVNRDVLKRLRMPSWTGVVPVLAVLTLIATCYRPSTPETETPP